MDGIGSKFCSALEKVTRLASRLLEGLVIVTMGVLVVDVLWGVLSRHLLQSQSGWTEELARFLLIWVGLLGASLGFGKQAHLGMDFLTSKIHPSGRRFLETAAHAVVLAFAVFVLLGGGLALVRQTLELGQITPALGWPKGWVYLAVPLSGLFMILFSIQNMVTSWNAAPGPVEDEVAS